MEQVHLLAVDHICQVVVLANISKDVGSVARWLQVQLPPFRRVLGPDINVRALSQSRELAPPLATNREIKHTAMFDIMLGHDHIERSW